MFVLNKADLNAALAHYSEAQAMLNKKATQLMKQNADLEKQHEALIVINNPAPPSPTAKLIKTVMQAMPADSKTNKLLRFGSKGWPKKGNKNGRFKNRNSLPCVNNLENQQNVEDGEESFKTVVTVHRSMT